MKKLITLIGAAATAFGLYAVTVQRNSIDFNDVDPGVFGFPEEDERLFWYNTNTFADVSGIVTNGTSNQYLLLDTDTNIVYRTAAYVTGEGATVQQVDVGTGVYFNQKVKFSVFEEDPTDLGDAKLAVWLKADAGVTNLYVSTAALGIGLSPTQTTNVLLRSENGDPISLDPDTFYQLKITAMSVYKDADPTVLGFAITINGNPCKVSDTLWPDLAIAKTVAASKLMAEKKLFPSRVDRNAGATAGATLTGVGYQGTGAIESVLVNGGNEFEITTNLVALLPDHIEIDGDVVSTNGYTVSPSLAGYTIAKGDTIRVTLRAEAGWKLVGQSVYEFVIDGETAISFAGTSAAEDTYTVTFINGVTEEQIDQTNVVANATVVAPGVPPIAGKSFDNWYETNSVPAGAVFNFATAITNDLDIFARYTNTLYTIETTGGTNANVVLSPVGPYTNGQDVVITATATSGCEYAESSYGDWAKDGNKLTLDYKVNTTGNTVEVPNATVASPTTPVLPEGHTEVNADSVDAATNKVEVAVPAAVATRLSTEQQTAYKAMFTKKATVIEEGKRYEVTVELSAATSNEVQTAITTANAATLTNVLAIAANTSTNVVVTTKPGLYYQIVASTVLPISAPASDSKNWQMAIGDTESLPVTRPSGPKAFFRVYCTDVATP